MTVPASASQFTGRPDPATTQAIARGLLAEPYPLAQVNTSRTLATQAVLAVSQMSQANLPALLSSRKIGAPSIRATVAEWLSSAPAAASLAPEWTS